MAPSCELTKFVHQADAWAQVYNPTRLYWRTMSTCENKSVAFEHVQEQSILNSPAQLQPSRVDELELPPACRATEQITGFGPKMAPSANSVPVQDLITIFQDGL